MQIHKNHIKAIKLIVEGKKHDDIAKACKISPATLSNWKSHETFQAELNKQREMSILNAREVMTSAAEKASFVLVELLDCRIPSVKLKAAKEILDRLWGSPTQHQQITQEVRGELNIDSQAALANDETKQLLRQLHSKLNQS